MNILFIGGVFSDKSEQEILKNSKGNVQYAANKLQLNLIHGFSKLEEVSIRVLSASFVGSYPKEYKKIFINGSRETIDDSIMLNSVSFCNLWGYRSISRKNHLTKMVKDFSKEQKDDKAIIVYSPHTPFLQAAVYAKKKDPSMHICLIVPDLPQFMNLNDKRTFIYDKLKEIDIKIFNRNLKYVDSFVLLTEHMKDILKIDNKPYIVIEGVVNTNETNDKQVQGKNVSKKTVVYTGTLNSKFGVVNLVKAFNALNRDDVSLEICGRGDSEDIIKEYAQKDKRIHFLGQLSNEKAVKLQKKATILINPRQNNEEFTKYSFPSKNMEYLLSGNPVIAYKLDGIPDEYDDYFFYVKENSVKELTDKMNEVLTLDSKERYEFGNRAKEFIIKNKNNIEASLKIINMIKNSKDR